MATRLRWKLEPKETGLRSIGAGPRSSRLHDGSTTYAMVSAARVGLRHEWNGWYWVAGWNSGIPHKNTCGKLCATADEAKAQAMDYVKQHLAARQSKGEAS